MNKKLFLAALVPLLALTAIIAQKEYAFKTAKAWRLPIAAYDPVDLLYGRYLDVRINWPFADVPDLCHTYPTPCRLCISGDPLKPKMEVISSDDQASKCDSKLARGITWIEPTANYSYYLSEQAAPMMDDLLRDARHQFSVDVLVTKGGHGRLGMLYIDGKPWVDVDIEKLIHEGEARRPRSVPPAVPPTER